MAVSVQRRQELCQERVFLNGEPARINGYARCWASVTLTASIEAGRPRGVTLSWEEVERVVSRGGRFGS